MPSEVEKVARAIPDEAVEKALLVFYGGKLTVDEMWRINGEDLRPAMRAAIEAALAAMTGAEPYAGKPPKAEPNAVVEALEFYADEKRWEAFSDDERAAYASHNFGSELGDDMGQKARDALQSMAKAKVA